VLIDKTWAASFESIGEAEKNGSRPIPARIQTVTSTKPVFARENLPKIMAGFGCTDLPAFFLPHPRLPPEG
jgi:hypothetical protein